MNSLNHLEMLNLAKSSCTISSFAAQLVGVRRNSLSVVVSKEGAEPKRNSPSVAAFIGQSVSFPKLPHTTQRSWRYTLYHNLCQKHKL